MQPPRTAGHVQLKPFVLATASTAAVVAVTPARYQVSQVAVTRVAAAGGDLGTATGMRAASVPTISFNCSWMLANYHSSMAIDFREQLTALSRSGRQRAALHAGRRRVSLACPSPFAQVESRWFMILCVRCHCVA